MNRNVLYLSSTVNFPQSRHGSLESGPSSTTHGLAVAWLNPERASSRDRPPGGGEPTRVVDAYPGERSGTDSVVAAGHTTANCCDRVTPQVTVAEEPAGVVPTWPNSLGDHRLWNALRVNLFNDRVFSTGCAVKG